MEVSSPSYSLTQVVSWTSGIVGVIFSFLVAPIIKVIWGKHNEEIKSLKSSITKIELLVGQRVETVTFNKTEERMRDNVIDIYREIKALSGELHKRIDDIDKTATSRHIELLTALGSRPKS